MNINFQYHDRLISVFHFTFHCMIIAVQVIMCASSYTAVISELIRYIGEKKVVLGFLCICIIEVVYYM